MKYIKGDIIKAFENNDIDVILHQCNCVKGHGKGIAQTLFQKYPEINIPYISFYKGDYKPIYLRDNKWIINMYTQFYPGPPVNEGDSFKIRMEWLKECLKRISYSFGDLTVGMPLIASGLAADKNLKGNMSDLEYFKKYIAETVENYLPNAKIYYL